MKKLMKNFNRLLGNQGITKKGTLPVQNTIIPEFSPKKPEASVSKICFSGGKEYSFNPKEKVILVGPNNSGKSQTLREILDIASNGKKNRHVVVKKVDIRKEGSSEDLKKFLEENATFKSGNYFYKDWSIHDTHIHNWDEPLLRFELADGFIKKIGADERLQICDQQDSFEIGEQKTKPQHVLYDDSDLMERVSDFFRKAFGVGLMIDYRGAQKIPIHIGEKPDETVYGENPISNEYANAVRVNPLLDKQGDGMRSYAGILFETIISDLDINLLDEPEAFLHPPQMRHIGQTLASEVNGQLFVATHSSDIMRGFLEGSEGNVRLLRINRVGDQNFVKEAKPKVVQKLWNNPILRYSKALEGIFHEETIVCEDESDCRLLNAVADHLVENDIHSWKDTAYVPAGGKHTIKNVVDVLRQVGVPVKAVFDIDFLSEETLVKETVEVFGGKWSNIKSLWKRVDAAVRNGIKPRKPGDIKDELITEINKCAPYDIPSKSKLNEILKQDSSWNMVKKFGKTVIPHGDAQANFKKLNEELEKIGIYLIDKGEIENFYMEVGSHGSKFVTKLLANVPLD
ncbi:MAG: AAA family ATPase, partial [Rhodobacteraceae bacterium]|nr:AAA family ATPase [Paracoccaceae bacterium]